MWHFETKCLRKFIREWSKEKGANITLNSLKYEIKTFCELTGKENFQKVLEIGSGSGIFLTFLAYSGFADKYLGVDPCFADEGTSKNELIKTKRLVNELDLDNKVIFSVETFEEFLEKDIEKKFDLVVFRESLHHIYPKKKGLRQQKEMY